jgi:hypothetical protein
MLHVPLSAIANQTTSVNLGGQPAQISIRKIGASLYFTLQNGTVPIVTTRICRNMQRILLDSQYRPFVGDFFFKDTQGDTDPQFQGLDTRYFLYYLEASDLA